MCSCVWLRCVVVDGRGCGEAVGRQGAHARAHGCVRAAARLHHHPRAAWCLPCVHARCHPCTDSDPIHAGPGPMVHRSRSRSPLPSLGYPVRRRPPALEAAEGHARWVAGVGAATAAAAPHLQAPAPAPGPGTPSGYGFWVLGLLWQQVWVLSLLWQQLRRRSMDVVVGPCACPWPTLGREAAEGHAWWVAGGGCA